MVDPRLAELIQGDLDGDLTGPDRAEFGRAMLADPEARRLHAALQRTDAALKAVPDVDPPPELRSRILDSAFPREDGRASATTRREQGTAGLFRYAAVFAGGLLVASLAFYLSGPDGTTISREDLAGTMAGAISNGEVVGEALLDAGGSDARVLVFRAGRVTVVEATLAGESGAVLEIGYDPEALRLTGIVPGADALDLRKGPGRLDLGMENGPRRLYFEGPEQAVELDVALRSASGQRDEERLTVAAER